MKYLAQKDQVSAWLAKLADKYTMLAPKAVATAVLFQNYSADEIAKADVDALLDYTTTSMKKAYIPETEVLLSYSSKKEEGNLSKRDMTVTCEIEAKETVIFGARPCDAKAVLVQDAQYLGGKYRDPYYAARREKICVITQACNETLPSCFCNTTDTDLTSPYASDVFFTITAKGFVFEAITENGKALLEVAAFEQVGDEINAEVQAMHERAHATLPEKADMSKIDQIHSFNFENNDFWAKVTAGCIGCSSCTFVCPTCQCFTITDEGNPLEGKRIRSWSSCMGNEFTLEASGHNPRSVGYTRWRNRLGHKFNYMLSWHKNLFSCTGCGRCLQSCPATISIKNMIDEMIKATPADAQLPKSRACTTTCSNEAVKEEASQAQASAPKAQAQKKAPAKKA